MRLLWFTSWYCDRTLLLLLRTFLDIVALKKGPEHLPRSWLLLVLVLAATFVVWFCAIVLIPPLAEQDQVLTLVAGFVNVGFYALVLVIAGYSRRLLQTLTAVIGCGVIVSVLFVAEIVLFRPILGADAAGVIAILIIFWLVPVEGHIISRAIDRHWYVGIAIAVAAFTLQHAFHNFAARA